MPVRKRDKQHLSLESPRLEEDMLGLVLGREAAACAGMLGPLVAQEGGGLRLWRGQPGSSKSVSSSQFCLWTDVSLSPLRACGEPFSHTRHSQLLLHSWQSPCHLHASDCSPAMWGGMSYCHSCALRAQSARSSAPAPRWPMKR